MLDIVASYYFMLLQGKLMNETWENDKNSSFGPDFDPFDPKFWPKFFRPFNLHYKL